MRPRPPPGPPPGMAKGAGKPAKLFVPSHVQRDAPSMYAATEVYANMPSFIGAASRKRKRELAAELGLVPRLGHIAEVVAQQRQYYSPAFKAQPSTSAHLQRQANTKHGGKMGGKGTGIGKGAWLPKRAGGRGGSPVLEQPEEVGEEDGIDDEVGHQGSEAEFESDSEHGDDADREDEVEPSTTSGNRKSGLRGKGKGAHPAASCAPLRAKATLRHTLSEPVAAMVAETVDEGGGPVKWLTLPPSSSFVLDGMPDLGPAVYHAENLGALLTSAQTILAELGVEKEEVSVTHDPDWDLHPEVGEALRTAGGEELCYCIMESRKTSIWAVGAGHSWKKREQAGRLALCVALAANVADFGGLARSQPGFTAFCEGAGIATGIAGLPPVQIALPAQRNHKAVATGSKQGSGTNTTNTISLGSGGSGRMRDKPFWISLAGKEEALPEALEGLPLEGLVFSNDGTGRKALYNKADAAVAHVVGDLTNDVEYHDDANWEHFPIVGSSLLQAGFPEECICVAVCASASVWAVGVGMKSKNRHSAAKIALAAAIALQIVELGQEVDYEDFPALAEVVGEATTARGL